MNKRFYYCSGDEVLLGDSINVGLDRMAFVAEIIQPNSVRAHQWGVLSGVILRFTDSDTGCWLVDCFDEDFELCERHLAQQK
ncbi:MAG: hypothetical protein ACRC46_04175 [Thermoguttaceae bacterium]